MKLCRSRNILLWTGWIRETTPEPEPFRIKQFEQEPGIYFEGIGQVAHIDSWWKMVIKIDTNTLSHRFQQLREYAGENENICYHPLEVEARDACKNLFRLINKEIKQLEGLLKRLNSIYKTPTNKRGLINAIGTIAKTLFGTMDAEDEENINEQIKLIEGNQQVAQHAIKTQIKILNATIAHVDSLERTVQENEEVIWNLTQRINQRLTGVIQREDMDEHLFIVNAILNDLTRDTEDVIEHLTLAKIGRIHDRLVPVEHIIASLKEVAPQLTQGVQFPFQISIENWPKIEKFVTISAYYENAKIYTILKLPLITYPAYRIIKAIPLPVHDHKDVFTFTEVNQHTLAVDTDGRSYHVTSENELNKCILTDENSKMYICEQYDPVYNVDINAPCEIQAYLQLPSYKASCKSRHFVSNATVWIPLHNSHAWLYSTRIGQRAVIKCNTDGEHQITLQRTGQVMLGQNCKLVTTEMTIKGKGRTFESQIRTLLPSFNVTLLRGRQEFADVADMLEKVKIKGVVQKPEELKQLSISLDTLKTELEKNYSVFKSKEFIYPAISTTSLIIIASAIAIAIIVIRKRRIKQSETTNASTIINPPRIPRLEVKTNRTRNRDTLASRAPSTFRIGASDAVSHQ